MQVQGVLWNGVKVFSATTFKTRAAIGDEITTWIASNPMKKIIEMRTLQSSDTEFHCLSIVVLYNDTGKKP